MKFSLVLSSTLVAIALSMLASCDRRAQFAGLVAESDHVVSKVTFAVEDGVVPEETEVDWVITYFERDELHQRLGEQTHRTPEDVEDALEVVVLGGEEKHFQLTARGADLAAAEYLMTAAYAEFEEDLRTIAQGELDRRLAELEIKMEAQKEKVDAAREKMESVMRDAGVKDTEAEFRRIDAEDERAM